MNTIATYTRKLKDSSGNFVAPATRASCVYMSDNTTLEDFVNNLDLRVTGIYPVGSIYQSAVEESPSSLFGGEWEKLENTFLYGSGTKTLGDTGGEETHKLTISEMPSHYHTPPNGGEFATNTSQSGNAEFGGGSYWYKSNKTSSAGSDQPHNNMPPYTVINIWKRVA